MPILNPPGQLRPDPSDPYGLLALVSNINNYSVNLVNVTQSGINVTLTGPQAISGVVRLTGTASNNFTVTLPPTPRLIDALGPTIAKDGSYAVPISIQNEDPTFTCTLTPGDSLTTINGTAQVVAGTRRIWLMTVGTPYDPTVVSIQNIGTFSTTAITVGGGSVTSVGQTVPPEFTISGSPVTTAGTLAIGKANETANTVWAGPTSGGVAPPTFRPLVLADIPGGVGTGSVTSVGLSMPAEFSVAGTPVTTSGTLAVTKATESANTVWAGPTSGAPAQPTFRSLVAADLPAGGSGGTLQSQTFTSNGTFTPASGVTAVWIDLYAGGGAGGGGTASIPGTGGGSGEYCEGFLVPISGPTTVTIGAGGTPGAAGAGGGNGNNTSFGNWTVRGGVGGNSGNGAIGGSGGGVKGGIGSSSSVIGAVGSAESPTFFGGSAGGANSFPGGGSAGFVTGAAGGGSGGGGGGGATPLGATGTGGAQNAAGTAASANTGNGGGGGGNGSSTLGGAGGSGYAVVYWIS